MRSKILSVKQMLFLFGGTKGKLTQQTGYYKQDRDHCKSMNFGEEINLKIFAN